MNLLQIEERLRNKTINIDYKSHHVYDMSTIVTQRVNDNLKWIKELETGKYKDREGLWDKDKCDDMIRYLRNELETDLKIGKFLHKTEHRCYNCDKSLYLVIVDENTVSLISYRAFSDTRESKGLTYHDDFIMDSLEIPECFAKSLLDAQKMVTEINVPTGQLLFLNYFSEKKIYSFPDEINSYDSDHSINGLVGRNNLMQYLASLNIGYCQMGNMSVNVFLNKAGDEIIIGSDYGYTEERGEYTITHKGFENIGSICLDVWRWMCGDLKVLQGYGQSVPDNLEVNKHTTYDYKDYILTKVQPGTWVIEHFYDFAKDENIDIYSRLYLKKST